MGTRKQLLDELSQDKESLDGRISTWRAWEARQFSFFQNLETILKTEETMEFSGAFGRLLMDLALWVYSQKVKGCHQQGECSERSVCEGRYLWRCLTNHWSLGLDQRSRLYTHRYLPERNSSEATGIDSIAKGQGWNSMNILISVARDKNISGSTVHPSDTFEANLKTLNSEG